MKPIVSVVIPVRIETPYLKETLDKLKLQNFKYFEILVITDEFSNKHGLSKHHLGPSFKRNLAAKIAKGKFLAFLDDDSFPDKNWLKNALEIFEKHPNATAVCGPCLTPQNDNIFQKASGLFWSSSLGSGGAGNYRNSIKPNRLVDDYPTVNLIVIKKYFDKIGGFNNNYWPGEDTILCLDITKKLKKQIIYSPNVLVFHHRRNIIIPHLQQITRYAIHRGYFAKKFPQTSLRPGYLAPSIFTIYIAISFIINIISLVNSKFSNMYIVWLNLPLHLYMALLIITYFKFIKNNNFLTSLMATITIPITHIYYGFLFLVGFSKKKLEFQPHEVDTTTNKYIGG